MLDPANGYVPSALTKAAATALNHLQKNRSKADQKEGKNKNKNLQRRKSEGLVPRGEADLTHIIIARESLVGKVLQAGVPGRCTHAKPGFEQCGQ